MTLPNFFNMIDEEIILDPSKVSMSKMDKDGIISYANAYFVEISGYQDHELLNNRHTLIRHPEMPEVIINLMWERLHKGENIYAVVKNLAKDGRYYWVITCFETVFDNNGNIIAHYARRKAVPTKTKSEIKNLYKILREIELNESEETAKKYFYGFFENKRMTYDAFILETLNMSKREVEEYFKGSNLNSNITKNGIYEEVEIGIIERALLENDTIKTFKDANKDVPKSAQKIKSKISKLQSDLDVILEDKAIKKRENFFSRFFSSF